MSLTARGGFLGLITNVACTQAPPGALQDAENVVLRRAGCVEPRDGVKLLHTAAQNVAWGFSYGGKDIYGRYAGGLFSYASTAGDAYTYGSSLVDPQPLRRDILSQVQIRGNAYVPYDAGVLKLESGTGQFRFTGVPNAARLLSQGVFFTAGKVWLPTTSRVAYRAVCVHTDSNGVTRRSSPSGAITVTNTTGSTVSLMLNVDVEPNQLLRNNLSSVELYRTRTFAAGTAPDDEMQKIATISFTYPTASATYVDRVADSERGETLYTSPSRGGILAQNELPPACAVVSAFKGSVFFANTRGPRRLKLSRFWEGVTAAATGIGQRDITGATTSGSPTITGASSTTGLQKGMYENGSGRWITNISGTTLTMNGNMPTTGGATALSFYDSIKVVSPSSPNQWIPAQIFDYAAMAFGGGAGVDFFVYGITPPEGGANNTYILEAISRGTTAITIQATHGSEYTPPLPDYDGAPQALAQDTFPGAIMWSKKDEPEHMRPDAYAFVGDAKKAILGLVPTRDALFILKEDGIFRLTGDGATLGVADPWRIDPYDPTTRCLLPSSVKPLNGRAYFLSNKGVIAFGDGGPEPVSLPIHDQIRDVIDQVQANFLANGYYELTGVVGSTAAVYERENEYTLMRSTTAHPLVYNESTRAWTSWRYYSHAAEALSYGALFTFDREGRTVYALGAALYGTRVSTDSQLGALTALLSKNDRETTVTASSWNSATSTVTLSGAVTALEDDVIQDAAGKLWRVTAAVASSTTLILDGPTTGTTFTTGATCVLYRSMRCRVAPQTFFDAPMVGKDSSPFTVLFSRFHGPVALAGRYSSVLTPLEADSWTEEDVELVTPNGYTEHARGAAYPQDVPHAHARGWLIDAGTRWVMTHGIVRLEGVYMQAKVMSPRSKQQVAA